MLVRKNGAELPKLGDNHAYSTRHRNQFRFPEHRTVRFEAKPNYAGVRLHDKLPGHIKEIAGRNKFKAALKQYLLERCCYSLNEFLH